MNNKGFSLIEIILVISITGILAGIMSLMFRSGLNTYLAGHQHHELTTRANITLNRIDKELSRATQFNTATASQLSFTNYDEQSITFVIKGGALLMKIDDSNYKTLANKVKKAQFTYANKQFNTTGNLNDIRLITTQLILSNEGQDYEVMGVAYPRNAHD